MTVIIPTSQCNRCGYYLIIVATSQEHSLLARFWVFCTYYVMGWALVVLPFYREEREAGRGTVIWCRSQSRLPPRQTSLFTTTLWIQQALQKWQLLGRNKVYHMAFLSTQKETESILILCLPPQIFFLCR